jgi:hypothetical protein
MQYPPRSRHPIAWGVAAAIGLSALTAQAAVNRRADFGTTHASRDTITVANGIVAANDNQGSPFIILDKVNAHVFVFDRTGRLQASAPALLGSARGDDTVPGIGKKKIADVKPEERTTPAGRFVAEYGRSSTRGEDVVWVDYDAAVSMHRVVTSNPKEHRLERLATPTPKDNRISYGCINLPKAFYERWVGPTVQHTRTIVYVLPETRPARQVFAFLDHDRDRAVAKVARGPHPVARSMRAGPPDGGMPIIDQ